MERRHRVSRVAQQRDAVRVRARLVLHLLRVALNLLRYFFATFPILRASSRGFQGPCNVSLYCTKIELKSGLCGLYRMSVIKSQQKCFDCSHLKYAQAIQIMKILPHKFKTIKSSVYTSAFQSDKI